MVDGGLGFWLSYVESRGGLWERSGDTALVMIPPQLQRNLELPEEFAVTERADVAREDGVALLGPGHPLLMAAAEDVLSADDAGVLQLPAPAAQRPDDTRLLERAREAFPVDHGRIDASGPAEQSLRQVLQVGAMVNYTASADDRFHERAECWVDAPSRLELPEQAAERMRRLAADGCPAAAAPDLGAIPPALAAAHRLLDLTAAGRCGVLADGSVRAAADMERGRTQRYYAEALASLSRRRANAPPDRQALLAARMDSLQAEENRRLAEIDEKYTPRYEIRPYRLHLLHVPALRLPVERAPGCPALSAGAGMASAGGRVCAAAMSWLRIGRPGMAACRSQDPSWLCALPGQGGSGPGGLAGSHTGVCGPGTRPSQHNGTSAALDEACAGETG